VGFTPSPSAVLIGATLDLMARWLWGGVILLVAGMLIGAWRENRKSHD
jgi:cytochrome c biogenesis factor